MKIGDRVILEDRTGTIKDFYEGRFVSIKWDEGSAELYTRDRLETDLMSSAVGRTSPWPWPQFRRYVRRYDRRGQQ